MKQLVSHVLWSDRWVLQATGKFISTNFACIKTVITVSIFSLKEDIWLKSSEPITINDHFQFVISIFYRIKLLSLLHQIGNSINFVSKQIVGKKEWNRAYRSTDRDDAKLWHSSSPSPTPHSSTLWFKVTKLWTVCEGGALLRCMVSNWQWGRLLVCTSHFQSNQYKQIKRAEDNFFVEAR